MGVSTETGLPEELLNGSKTLESTIFRWDTQLLVIRCINLVIMDLRTGGGEFDLFGY